jgi:hypothetical protein
MFDQLLEESVTEAEAVVATVTTFVVVPARGAVLAAMVEAANAMPDDSELASALKTKMFLFKSLPWWE